MRKPLRPVQMKRPDRLTHFRLIPMRLKIPRNCPLRSRRRCLMGRKKALRTLLPALCLAPVKRPTRLDCLMVLQRRPQSRLAC